MAVAYRQPEAAPAPATLPRAGRLLAALAVAAAAGLAALTITAGLTGSPPAAAAAAALGAVLGGAVAWKRSPAALDPAACTRGLWTVSALATLVALVVLGRLAVFVLDPAQVAYSTIPASAWEVRHSCLTAYFVAGQAAGQGQDPYDDALYTAPDDDPNAVRKPRRIGPFAVDVYEYPPPFLLGPRACGLVTPDFMRLRMLWFGLELAILLVAFVVVARELGPAARTRALLLSPLVLAALPTWSALQKGNVHLPVIAFAMLGMALLERRRYAAGGALLAYAVVSKLFPALLVLYLMARRDWRAVGWTVGMGIALVGITLVDLGWAPFDGFLRHLPGLLGGEAFPAFRNPAATAINFSVPGLVFKLKLFGVPGAGFAWARVVGTLSTLVLVAVVIHAARSRHRPGTKPLVWIAILTLASLCSPFLPQAYAAFAPLWLLTLLAATRPPNARTLGLVLVAWLGLSVYWPNDWGLDPRLVAAAILVPQAVTLGLAVVAVRGGGRPVRMIP